MKYPYLQSINFCLHITNIEIMIKEVLKYFKRVFW